MQGTSALSRMDTIIYVVEFGGDSRKLFLIQQPWSRATRAFGKRLSQKSTAHLEDVVCARCQDARK